MPEVTRRCTSDWRLHHAQMPGDLFSIQLAVYVFNLINNNILVCPKLFY
jgi:hypothetical protein